MHASILRPLTVFTLLIVICIVCVQGLGSAAPGKSQESEPASYRDVVKKVLPAVVSVEATAKSAKPTANLLRWRDEMPIPQEFSKFFEDFQTPFDRQETPHRGFGSGFIIDGAGVAVTNYHVVKGATEVTVRLQDGRQFTATEIKTDPRTDLAVIRFDPKETLPHLEFSDGSALEIGDRVLAVGAPFGLAGSVSAGIISGKGRKLNNTIYEDFLQTDAAINPGNSGGPLVSLDGKVIGVNTAIRTNSGGWQGVGLAISSNVAREVVDKLRKDGTVRRGYLGVQVQQLEQEIAARLGIESKSGVVVARVLDGSPAAKADIRPGDVIVSVAGTAVKTPMDLQRRIVDLSPGKAATFNLRRDGKALDVSVTIEEQPGETSHSAVMPGPTPKSPSGTRIDKFGIEMADITPDLSRQYGFDQAAAGVAITRIAPGSLAARAGLRSGTMVTKIDTASVRSAAEADAALQKASLEQGVLLQVQYPDGAAGYVMIKSNMGR